MKRKVLTILAAAAVGFGIVGCTSVGAGEMAVMVDSFGSPTVSGCQGPETWEFTPMSDAYKYPSRQISWDATGVEGAEAYPTLVVSNAEAPAELRVPYIVTMDLTTDCDQLKEFHREFGTKYKDDWNGLVRYVIGVPAEQTVISVAQGYTWRQIWNDEDARIAFQNALKERLPEASKARTNGKEYFRNFQVTVLKPDPVDQQLKDAIAAEQNAVAQARAAESKGVADAAAKEAAAEAEVKAAVAQTEVARQQAIQRRAEIAGYPSVEDYLKAKLIEGGGNPYQPVIVPGMPK